MIYRIQTKYSDDLCVIEQLTVAITENLVAPSTFFLLDLHEGTRRRGERSKPEVKVVTPMYSAHCFACYDRIVIVGLHQD